MATVADGSLVPYVDDDLTDAENANAVAYALEDIAAAGTVIKVTKDDSYRFSVGDILVIAEDGTPTYMDGGAITAIDRTTAPNFASITFTEGALGATTSVVVSNAVLNSNFMIGLDSAAVTALGGVLDGNNLILK